MKMKMKNMTILKHFFMKHKYTILLAIVLLFLLFFLMPSFREGLTNAAVGEYTYLAPIPTGNTWDQTTMVKFANKYNEVNNKTGDQMLQGNADSLKQYISLALSAEANYYIDNGKWIYCNYVSTYVEKHPEVLSTLHDASGNVMTPTTLQKTFPNRLAYSMLIGKTEKSMTPTPLSYQIYMGTAQPPPSSSSSSSSSSSPAHSLSDTNYQQLVSLCKNVMGNKQ